MPSSLSPYQIRIWLTTKIRCSRSRIRTSCGIWLLNRALQDADKCLDRYKHIKFIKESYKISVCLCVCLFVSACLKLFFFSHQYNLPNVLWDLSDAPWLTNTWSLNWDSLKWFHLPLTYRLCHFFLPAFLSHLTLSSLPTCLSYMYSTLYSPSVPSGLSIVVFQSQLCFY